jgi:hypothetical protein
MGVTNFFKEILTEIVTGVDTKDSGGSIQRALAIVAKQKAISSAKSAAWKYAQNNIISPNATQNLKTAAITNKKPADQKKLLSPKKTKSASVISSGNLYFFSYLPETRQQLKYYDEFPLVLVLEKRKEGVLGLNFHYLRHDHRAKFFDRLVEYVDTADYISNPETELMVGYELMKHPKFKPFVEPCIKFYKYKNFKTGVVRIEPAKWKLMMFLPLEKFSKMATEDVWKCSDQQIST